MPRKDRYCYSFGSSAYYTQQNYLILGSILTAQSRDW